MDNYRSSAHKATTIALFSAEVQHFTSKTFFLEKIFWLWQMDLYAFVSDEKTTETTENKREEKKL